jgi:tRNA U34 5-methylaminomethyl-2-thiouridine-forming methyltransferase MnmC
MANRTGTHANHEPSFSTERPLPPAQQLELDAMVEVSHIRSAMIYLDSFSSEILGRGSALMVASLLLSETLEFCEY